MRKAPRPLSHRPLRAITIAWWHHSMPGSENQSKSLRVTKIFAAAHRPARTGGARCDTKGLTGCLLRPWHPAWVAADQLVRRAAHLARPTTRCWCRPPPSRAVVGDSERFQSQISKIKGREDAGKNWEGKIAARHLNVLFFICSLQDRISSANEPRL